MIAPEAPIGAEFTSCKLADSALWLAVQRLLAAAEQLGPENIPGPLQEHFLNLELTTQRFQVEPKCLPGAGFHRFPASISSLPLPGAGFLRGFSAPISSLASKPGSAQVRWDNGPLPDTSDPSLIAAADQRPI